MKSTQIALAFLAVALAATAVKATEKTMGGGGDSQSANLPAATQIAMQRNPVTLYTSSSCGDSCSTARDLLEKRGVPYTERDPLKSAADQDALKNLIGGLFVPVLVVGSSPIKGYQEDDWNAALDSAGYLRTRLPGQGSMRRLPEGTK